MCHNALLKNLPRILLLLYSSWHLTLFPAFICIIHLCPTKILRNISVWESKFSAGYCIVRIGDGFEAFTYIHATYTELPCNFAHSYSTLLLCFFSTSLTFLLLSSCPFTNADTNTHTLLLIVLLNLSSESKDVLTKSTKWHWECLWIFIKLTCIIFW